MPAMDNDSIRRGKPTCHVAYGEDIALLAGDCLNVFAFETFLNQATPFFDAKAILDATKYVTQASGINGMCGGQALDLKSTGSKESIDTLNQIHKMKTGALIESCFFIPALLKQAPNEDVNKLRDIGLKTGLLFQIIDDILDVKGSSEELGKTSGKDQDQNKLTYISYWGSGKSTA